MFKIIKGPFKKLTGLLLVNMKNIIPMNAIPNAKEKTGCRMYLIK